MNIWRESQKILVILAHPDDPDFFCGASIAKWVREGHTISYCLMTRGEKGINDHFHPADVESIKKIRENEQKEAAEILGVGEITYLDQPDGYLIPHIYIRRQVVKIIRTIRPDIVVTCDPTNYYLRDTYINHPDHRAAGQIVIDSVFPAAQNPSFFPDLFISKNLQPHKVKEVWLSLPYKPNVRIDVTKDWAQKINALHAHASQIGDRDAFDKRMLARRIKGTSITNPKYEEFFHRIILQR